MQRARIPMFCPECEKIMPKELDKKMYRLYDHCFDCQVILENKMRIDGTYENFEKIKSLRLKNFEILVINLNNRE